MARYAKLQRILIGCISVILALVCAFCLFIPHLHACEGVQCQICAVLSLYEMLWLPILTVAALLETVYLQKDLSHSNGMDTGCSLVQLKVKLSD